MKIFIRYARSIAAFLVVEMIFQIIYPSVTYALTSGPTQPEAQGFQPAGASDMVDLFTGDFSYNIPLFELPGPNGGYPFNLSYQSGGTMDQEASWVGYGWNLSPGAINRQMRGLPDEFNGDAVKTKMSVAHTVTVGVGIGANLEIFGGESSGGSLSVGFNIYNNSFKGIGYSIDGSVGYSKAAGGMAGSGASLGLSLDSKEGVNVSPSLSLGTKIGDFGLGVGYNSKTGLSSLSYTYDYTVSYKKTSTVIKNGLPTKVTEIRKVGSVSQSSAMSFAHPGYTPQITMPMSGTNIAATFKLGGAVWGIFGSPYITGFYNDQWLKYDKKWVSAPAFGYLHYQDVNSDQGLRDFTREKDGMIAKEQPNLPIPSLSYDVYSVTGQGIGAMYRPMRNDYGVIYDPSAASSSTGGAVGVDVGIPGHVGINLSVNHAKSTSGAWSSNNDIGGNFSFQRDSIGKPYEPWYFKVHGEPNIEKEEVINKIGGDSAVRVQLEDNNHFDPAATASLKTRSGKQFWAPSSASTNRERKRRNQVVQPITNDQLLQDDTLEMISLFKVRYLDENGGEHKYKRDAWPGHHNAGFTAISGEGLRYVYAIPAYNTFQEDVTFTTERPTDQSGRAKVVTSGADGDPKYDYDQSEKFLKRVQMPPYAHSYLLTSIVGPDYVDVKNDGVTEDDLGYWVKFTYQRTASGASPYKWRDPFSGAHYQEGWKTDPRDDKGTFAYGEKELWYLARAETRSHIAVFNMNTRWDGKGVKQKLQDTDVTEKEVYKLTSIDLYTRLGKNSGLKIKSVHFDYDYSICRGVFNNDDPAKSEATKGGKLTLKCLYFEYGTSKRGRLNPYRFTYKANSPDYNLHAFDRWGTYKPYPEGNYLYNHDFPYAEQDPVKKQAIDDNAAAWSLTKIELPSGGDLIIDYEVDDYAYVQHRPAMQMVQMVDPYVPEAQAAASTSYLLSDDNTMVRFKLEKPLKKSLVSDQKTEVLKYLDKQTKQLAFKIKVNLKKAGDDSQEFISGYADIDMDAPMTLQAIDGSDEYIYGTFYVVKEKGYNPFSKRAWQHLRTNQPELANSTKDLKQTDNSGERVSQIKGLASGDIVTQVRQMFSGFFDFCRNRGWGRRIEVGQSWIRLNSPDKIKYGGGVRVRQVTMKDGLTGNEESVYGQVYEYTTEEDGQIISSGVAAYEPMPGGEENALRYAKRYVNSAPLRSDNNLFFEYPVNESYYPGPQVGYRKVSVTSLAAASLAGKSVKNIDISGGRKLFPKGDGITYGTSGMTVNEFYTAKEFPVITEETDKDDKPYKLPLLIPFVGNISINRLTTTQGYNVITNDMHGKPKQVSNYRQDRSGKFEPNPISWVRYNYSKQEDRHYDGVLISELNNKFKLNDDGTLSLLTQNEIDSPPADVYTVGQENEFFVDMREYEDKAWTGGARFNTDFLIVIFGVIPVPIPWPSISKTESRLRSVVANKVIFKMGMLESTEAFDGGGIVKTSNLKWNKDTGATILTSVDNNFNAPVYTYSIPAYTKYKGMGASYLNSNFVFSVGGIQKDPYESTIYTFNVPNISDEKLQDLLVPGDELLLYSKEGEHLSNALAHVVYTGNTSGAMTLFSKEPLAATDYRCMIVRSGYRNQLSLNAGTITALADPLKKGTTKVYSKTIQVPQ